MLITLTPTITIRNDPFFWINGISVTDMELRDIRYFAVVAEHQHLGRAADALNLSSTALGKSLRRFEKSVGAKLVQRASKGLALTAAGAALLTRIRPLQGMLNDVRHEAADLAGGCSGHIKVGVSLGAPENVIADACVSLSEKFPSISLKISTADPIVLKNWLYKGEIDFCLTGLRQFSTAEFVYERLYDNPNVVIASAYHRLAKRKQISIADLVDERWASLSTAHQRAFSVFEANGLPLPPLALETNSPIVRLSAIAYAGHLGLSSRLLLRREALRYPLIELPVKELVLARTLAIIFRKGAYLSPTAKHLVEILKAQAREPSDRARRDRRTRV